MALTVGELVAYLDLESSKFNRGIDVAERKFRGAGDRISGIGTKIGGVLTMAAKGGVLALAGGLTAGAIAGFKFNSSIEQTTIAMGTMLGSEAKAVTLIGEVTKMASATPFEFPELADATKRLVAYGVAAKDAVPLMTRLGDISSALQIPIGELADIYGKMKVSGRITMEDMNQLAGRGIPIYSALAGVMGVSQDKIRGLVESGKVGFPQIESAFQKITDKGSMFGGMMDKQSRSFAGLWSTVKDSLTQVFATAVKPLFDWLSKTGMPALIAAMPKVQAAVTKGMGAIGNWVSEHKEQIFEFFGVLKTAMLWIIDHWKLVVFGIASIFAVKTSYRIANAIAAIGVNASNAVPGVRDMSKAMRLVPWIAALAGVTALADYLGTKFQTVMDEVSAKLLGSQKEVKKFQDMSKSRFEIKGKVAIQTEESKRNVTSLNNYVRSSVPPAFTAAGKNAHRNLANKIGQVVPMPGISGAEAAGKKAGDAAREKIKAALAQSIGASIKIGFNFGTGVGLSDSLGGIVDGYKAASTATSLIGHGYQVGASGPDLFDCSGLVKYVYNRSGLPGFPTYTGNQWPLGHLVANSAIQPGDQIFMRTGNQQYTDAFGWGHTGIAVGGGMMVHASGHSTGVIKSPVGAGYPWAARRQFAKGGYVKAQPGGVPALLGEAGGDEFVLSRLRQGTVGGDGVSVNVALEGDIIVQKVEDAHALVNTAVRAGVAEALTQVPRLLARSSAISSYGRPA